MSRILITGSSDGLGLSAARLLTSRGHQLGVLTGKTVCTAFSESAP